jgi:hypothetical protein
MKSKKRLFKTILEFLVLTLIMGFTVTWFMGTTYAVMSPGNPDVIVTIDGNGQISQEGNLYGSGLWYPDEKGRDGIIRIYNNYRSTRLTNLGVVVELNSYNQDYTELEVKQAFLSHMRLTIKKGQWLEFGEVPIVYDKPLADLMNGIILENNDQLSITASKPLDLKYTMRMDEDAGNNLQSLSAEVSFIIKTPLDYTAGEDGNHGGGSNHGGDNNSENNGIENNMPSGNAVTQILIEEPTIKIPDIDGHWAHDCIVALFEAKIIQGNESGNIRPDDNITRAEAAVLVGKALKLEPKDTLMPKYVDPIPKWARGYVNITSEEEIFKGYPFGWFRPSNNITREEMIAVLTRAFQLSLDDKGLELPFTDKNDIGNWALENVKIGYEDKVITGYPDNNYKPNNKITRAEAFTIICKLLKYHETHLQSLQ